MYKSCVVSSAAYSIVSGQIRQRRREKENAHKREMEKGLRLPAFQQGQAQGIYMIEQT